MPSIRLYIGAVVLTTALVVVAIVGGRGGAERMPESAGPVSVDRIAYVGRDGLIRTVTPDGSDERAVSPLDGFFTWPTWSPDSRRLVFSGLSDDGAGGGRISLFVFDSDVGRPHEVFVGEPGIAGVLAEGVLHYPLWSPDGTQVAFIAITSRGLTLFVDDLDDGDAPRYVLDRGPLWFSWSPDSQHLIVHRADRHFVVGTVGGIEVNPLEVRSLGYRVPAWSPRDETVALVSQTGPEELTLLTARVHDGGLDTIEPVIDDPRDPAFLWSPGAKFLAVAQAAGVINYLGLTLLVYDDLTLLPQNGSAEPVKIEDNILAYFWSPDGGRLAYVTLSGTRGALRWNVLDLADQTPIPLLDFIPSRDQLTMFQFFDQYAYSHSLWSPDSASLVFAGRVVNDVVTASFSSHPGHEGSHIYVLGVDDSRSVAAIAEGILGFWSTR